MKALIRVHSRLLVSMAVLGCTENDRQPLAQSVSARQTPGTTISGTTSGKSPSRPAESPSPIVLDHLDVLPASMGPLRIAAAWRVDSKAGPSLVIGKYGWPGESFGVDMSCSFPPQEKPDCDESVPIRLKLGGVKACASSKDDASSLSGPIIIWPSCSLQMEYGHQSRQRFDRLKQAATAAAPWTQTVLAASQSTADLAAIRRNRENGLLAASQRGNDKVVGLSHQLDANR